MTARMHLLFLKLTSHLRATMLQQCIHCSLSHRILCTALLQLLQLLFAALALQHQCKQIRGSYSLSKAAARAVSEDTQISCWMHAELQDIECCHSAAHWTAA